MAAAMAASLISGNAFDCFSVGWQAEIITKQAKMKVKCRIIFLRFGFRIERFENTKNQLV
jgi:hypothetical protein